MRSAAAFVAPSGHRAGAHLDDAAPDDLFPDGRRAGTRRRRARRGSSPCASRTADGIELNGWFLPAPGQPPPTTVIVFNGNAGNRAHRVELADALRRHGLQVLLMDYRGYGGNPGVPSERGLTEDSRAALCLRREPCRRRCVEARVFRRVSRRGRRRRSRVRAPAGRARPAIAVHVVDRRGAASLPVSAGPAAAAGSLPVASIASAPSGRRCSSLPATRSDRADRAEPAPVRCGAGPQGARGDRGRGSQRPRVAGRRRDGRCDRAFPSRPTGSDHGQVDRGVRPPVAGV